MGRPQEFDTTAAIDAVLAVFWERGLHRTSIDDLLDASGLARSSLYNAFGGKQALFEAAVQRYADSQIARLEKILDVPSLRKALEKLFHGASSDNHDGKGCMLVNCAGALVQGEGSEQPVLRHAFKRMFGAVEARIREAQKSGEISCRLDPEDAAMLICATLSGLRVFNKAGMPKVKLKNAADLAVQSILRQLE